MAVNASSQCFHGISMLLQLKTTCHAKCSMGWVTKSSTTTARLNIPTPICNQGSAISSKLSSTAEYGCYISSKPPKELMLQHSLVLPSFISAQCLGLPMVLFSAAKIQLEPLAVDLCQDPEDPTVLATAVQLTCLTMEPSHEISGVPQ